MGQRGPYGGIGGLGARVSAAGDANGDGIADLLIADSTNRRFFLVFGSTAPLGRDVLLDGPASGRSVLLNRSIPYYFGQRQAPAGDIGVVIEPGGLPEHPLARLLRDAAAGYVVQHQ